MDGAQQAAGTGVGAGRPLIDTRALGKLRSFSGKEEDWPTWVARGYLNMLDTRYRSLLEVSEGTSHYSDIASADLTDENKGLASVLFNLLVQCVDGRALEPGNGFQAWKALKENYRFTAMLMGIISPAQENVEE